jgi:outer membrane receptor protein involved in Fe transport
VLLAATPAHADDLADEADLHFQIGAERFQKGDYRTALEHFLLSNRLVPNHNVVFNIALTYEQLHAYPDAYRYFSQALDAENDAETRKTLSAALARVQPQVAVVQVVSEPPGATIYVDRKDLGPRGDAPRTLAFVPGHYTFFAELNGYQPVQSPPVAAEKGTSQKVVLKLVRIVGSVHVESNNPNAVAVADDPRTGERCSTPCTLSLPPGAHTLYGQAPGFKQSTELVEVGAGQTAEAQLDLQPELGELVVDADERGAWVEVDGRLAGFTPAVLHVPVGERHVVVTLRGFHPTDSTVVVREDEQVRIDAELIPTEEVEAASRSSESVDEAPSSVSIITRKELEAMGYPTIAEALRGVRSVFVNDDHSYAQVGLRGFGPAGSYGNRVLVLQDGHSTNDDWINSSYVGFDSRSDLLDVDRIEVVRGPGSVLYGTGAFTGVVNIVTRGQNDPDSRTFRLATYDQGSVMAHLGALEHVGEHGGFIASASGAIGQGTDYYFPEVAAAGDPSGGNSRNADGFQAGNLSLKAWYQALTFEASYNLRNKEAPTGEYETFVGDGRTRYVDGRGFGELRFEPTFGEHTQLFTRLYVDRYTYDSVLWGTPDTGGLREELYRGFWAGAEARLVITPNERLRLMAGGEGQYHFETYEKGRSYLDTPNPATYLNQSNPFQIGAAYALADWRPIDALHLSLGARLDAYSTFGSSVNPRLAIIFHPYEHGTFKLMAGQAFRAPSVYELYYNDGGLTQIPGCTSKPCSMKPETMRSAELEFTHHFNELWSLLVSGYANYITDLIALRDVPDNPGVSQYVNTTVPVLTLGAEAEIRREWQHGWTTTLSYAIQRSSYVQDANLPDDQRLREVPNSPTHLGSAKLAVPLITHVLSVMTRLTAESGRYDIHDQPGDPPQQKTNPSVVWDVVFSGEWSDWHLRYNLGAYNLADWRYNLPVSTEFDPITTVPENGRTLYASATFTF